MQFTIYDPGTNDDIIRARRTKTGIVVAGATGGWYGNSTGRGSNLGYRTAGCSDPSPSATETRSNPDPAEMHPSTRERERESICERVREREKVTDTQILCTLATILLQSMFVRHHFCSLTCYSHTRPESSHYAT